MNNNKPRVIVVIGGGGIKPFAAIPILDFLREEEIKIDHIVGSSGGAIVGALEALALPSRKKNDIIELTSSRNLFGNYSFKQILGMLHFPFFEYDKRKGLIKDSAILEELIRVFSDFTFNDLSTPLTVVGTGLWSGESVVISEGKLREAVYASSAIYPFMSPVRIEKDLIIDGSYSNPIPVDVAATYNPDIIIALTFDFLPDYAPPSFFRHYHNLFCRSIERKGIQKMHTDIASYEGQFIHIDVVLDSPISIFEADKLNRIFQSGQRALEDHKEQILSTYQEAMKKEEAA